jgi:hypothetical protein
VEITLENQSKNWFARNQAAHAIKFDAVPSTLKPSARPPPCGVFMETQSHPIRVLIVEADEDDYLVVRGLLADILAERYKLERVIDYLAVRDAFIRA